MSTRQVPGAVGRYLRIGLYICLAYGEYLVSLPYKDIRHPSSKRFFRVVMVYITPALDSTNQSINQSISQSINQSIGIFLSSLHGFCRGRNFLYFIILCKIGSAKKT